MNHDNERLLTVLEVVLLIAVIMFLLGIIYMAMGNRRRRHQ